MTAFVVFFRVLNDAFRDQVNEVGWNCPAGRAYLDACPRGEDIKPKYEDAIKFDMFEKAAFIRECEDKEALYALMQNRGANWSCEPTVKAYTDYPRSMSVGDIAYEPATDGWHYVASWGFEPVEDELFIEYLRGKITGPDL